MGHVPARAGALAALLLAAAGAPAFCASPAEPEPLERVRGVLEDRYALAAKALMSQDLKTFASLRAGGYQCRPAASVPPGARPWLAPAVAAAFTIKNLQLQGDQAVVENVETLEQQGSGGGKPARSQIHRRDVWARSGGVWLLKETEILQSTRDEPAPRRAPAGLAEAEAAREEIMASCLNEIGILCYRVQGDIREVKKCLASHETGWLKACKAALVKHDAAAGTP